MEPKKPYERKCKNWLTEFGRWALPRSEAPETYIFWTGLFTMSAVMRRKVKIGKEYLGSWEVSPNLYILFIADPGKARKTTTADYSIDLLDYIPNLTSAPDQVSMEKLLSALVNSPDASMYIHSGEFGEFMVKSGMNMYSFLTNAFDGRKKISTGTHIRGVEFAERPCVNLLGATTPAWIADNMPESVIGGGFASRVIFIFEERVRRRQLFYRNLNHKALDEIRDNLISDLKHFATLEGNFNLTEDAAEFMEDWYRRNADAGMGDQYKMHGYFERKPAHIMKIAMLVHLAYSDELILTVDDFKQAIKLLGQIEKKLPQTFSGVGRNPYMMDVKRIYEFVVENTSVKRSELHDKFSGSAEPAKLDELINGLTIANKLIATPTGADIVYTVKNKTTSPT